MIKTLMTKIMEFVTRSVTNVQGGNRGWAYGA
jgi:hypothetical protein